ncbi:MAG TPA: DUF3352 domain-containing protein [Blastocatellia bacterium]|nr:DUF3352 domain-containing protein [Blastocatellia bacterium]
MTLRDSLTRRNIILASLALVLVAAVAAYFLLRRPPRVAMERYVPANALGFVEIDSVSDLIDGLTDTKAWRELAPVLGLSSQLRQIGLGAELMGRTGLGPTEAVVAARAQYAIALMGIDASGGATDEGPYINFKPRFVLIAETHAAPEAVSNLLKERASFLARRVYGESVVEDSRDYYGSPLMIFNGPTQGRELVAASSASVALISNNRESIESCLDALEGRSPTLAADETLNQKRSVVDQNGSVFAFITQSGVSKLAELGPAIIASRAVNSVERMNSITDLIQNVSKETVTALLYAAEFTSDGVTERYLTVLRPRVAESLMPAFKPGTPNMNSLLLAPIDAREVTLLNVARIGELPERALKQIAPNLDVVAGIALREFVISFRKQYGLESSESAGDVIGDELSIVEIDAGQPRAMVISVRDRVKLAPLVERYLTLEGGTITPETYNGTELKVSSSDDRRAVAFVADYLVLATRDQIRRMIDTGAASGALAIDERFRKALANHPSGSPMLTYRPERDSAARLMLGISKLTRVTDGSPQLLEAGAMHGAVDRLPSVASSTSFRDYGIYSETRSAVGNFSALASLFGAGGDDEDE